ncbi:MAG: transporter substrate-binding domain-containing protein [Tissierellales bacterium]|jgi:polar amino acid transport system substrate-binding protein|nr:transporter substrate-binding domain-containing protein [Tissierellales bacterium]
MYKKIFMLLCVVLFLSLWIGNEYVKMHYNLSLIEYLKDDSELSQDEINWLNKEDVLIYGANYKSPPLRSINEKTGQYEGLVVDYIRQLSLELGLNIQSKPLIWHDSLTQLAEGKTDFCDMYISEERSKNFDFSLPVYYQRGVIVVAKNTTEVTSYKDLDGKKIAAVKGDYAFEFVDLESLNVSKLECKDLKEAIEALSAGKVDAVLGDESVINYYMIQMNLSSDYIILDDALYERPAVFGVKKGNDKLLSILNKGIRRLNQKGSLDKIYEKWFGITPLITKDKSQEKYILITKSLIAFILFLGISFYVLNIELKREVVKRTRELSISKNELQTTFDGLTYLMVVIDRNCIVKEANTALCKQIRYPKEKVINHHCTSINGILGTDCSNCLMKQSFEENRQLSKEIEYENRTYKVTTFLLETFPNLVDRVLVMIEDITDSKIKDQIMLQSSKMAAIGQLASGVAHEIRNPLGLIRNHCYLMKNSLDEPDELSDSISSIESSVNRANKIITNLLDFSRLTGNEIQSVNIYNFLEELSVLNSKNFAKKRINFSIDFDKNLILDLNTESLKHILINLIENATDAIKIDGNINISGYYKDDILTMQVSDDGVGMDENTISNVFNPFFTTKGPQQGTGLGLYITYTELEKMGGRISVESKLNEGTTFTLAIPSHKEDINHDKKL